MTRALAGLLAISLSATGCTVLAPRHRTLGVVADATWITGVVLAAASPPPCMETDPGQQFGCGV